MSNNQVRSWTFKIQKAGNESQRLRPPCWLALAVLVSSWGVPAAAQSYAYVPTHKSNSVSVINTAANSVIP
jgi:hypothetical protein